MSVETMTQCQSAVQCQTSKGDRDENARLSRERNAATIGVRTTTILGGELLRKFQNHSFAVPEFIGFNAVLLQQRQMQIAESRSFLATQVTTGL